MDVKESLDYFGKPMYTCQDAKVNEVMYTVRKSNDGYSFYSIDVSVGSVPEALQGSFSSAKRGIEAVTKYLEHKEPSKTLQRKAFREEFDARKSAADDSGKLQ